MPRVADHHKWKDPDHTPSVDWPDDTYVQWGASGIVVGKNPYRTAFFEAFPASRDDAGGFIRGEGKTIVEAENDALAKYQKQVACDHLWGRERYTNGGQLCRHCRAFRSRVLKEIVTLGAWRKPVKYYETWIYETAVEEGIEMTAYQRKLYLRSRVFGVTARPAVQECE